MAGKARQASYIAYLFGEQVVGEVCAIPFPSYARQTDIILTQRGDCGRVRWVGAALEPHGSACCSSQKRATRRSFYPQQNRENCRHTFHQGLLRGL